MGMSEQASAYFSWPEDLRHAPGPPDTVEGNRFASACRCGYSGKAVTSSPSHAYQATRIHAENENRREAGGGVIVQGDAYANDGTPPKGVRRSTPSGAPSGSSSTSRASGGTPCGCGCGEASGGLFRPGHDSKLLSRLMTSIRSGAITLAEAHEEMDKIGTSEKLKDKLAGKVGA